jgi:two-component system chemotaxis response regulator CheY
VSRVRRCLVVDDSRVIRRVARQIIGEFGMETEEAVDGREALEACRRQMPDCILLDWNMPVMSGIDFVRSLRREDGGHKPIVIFCTMENDVAHIREALRSGADEYIMKPFDSEILRSKFETVGMVAA